jgi:hypothetical protein
MQFTNDVLESDTGGEVRVLHHLLIYAEYQFWRNVTGRGGRSFMTEERDILNKISMRLIEHCRQDESLSVVTCNDMIFPYLQQSFRFFDPRFLDIESNTHNPIEGFSMDQMNENLEMLFRLEGKLAFITIMRGHFDTAEGHCQRCLTYSRSYRIEGEDKTSFVSTALIAYCDLRERQGKYLDALKFAEECYNLLAEAYSPKDLHVQKAALILTRITIKIGNLCDGERFAKTSYETLRDKFDIYVTDSCTASLGLVATSSHNFANVIYRGKGDMIQAEGHARTALSIRDRIYGTNHHAAGASCHLLARILCAQKDLKDQTRVNEIRVLFERSLGISIRNEGPFGMNTATAYLSFGKYYLKLVSASSAKLGAGYCLKAIDIFTRMFGSDHSYTSKAKKQYGDLLRKISEFRDGDGDGDNDDNGITSQFSDLISNATQEQLDESKAMVLSRQQQLDLNRISR